MVLNQHRSSKWEPIYERLYEIVKQDQGGAYVLKDELEEIMEPKSTIEMLNPIEKDISRNNDDRDSYEVEELLDHMQTKDGYEYLVKWKGYSAKENSWVKAKDFNNPKILIKYWRRKKNKNSTFSLEGSNVRLLSLSTTKNINKKRQELVNRQSDFDETKKFGITMKNYTIQNKRINDPNQFYAQPKLDKNNMSELGGDKTKWTNRTAKLNGQKDYYMDREDIVKMEGNERYYMTRLRPRTRPTIPGNSTKKHREMVNPR
jgi:hypothetical protein